MIEIVMTNGDHLRWKREEYTTYEYNYGMFIVKRGNQWIGIYNIGSVAYVEVDRDTRTVSLGTASIKL